MGGFLSSITGSLFSKVSEATESEDTENTESTEDAEESSLKSMIQDGLDSLLDKAKDIAKDAINEQIEFNQQVNGAEINIDNLNQPPERTENERLLSEALNTETHDAKPSIGSFILHGFSEKGVIDLGTLGQKIYGEGTLAEKDIKKLKPVNDLGIDLDTFKRLVDLKKPESNKGYVRFSQVKNAPGQLKLDTFGKKVVCLNLRYNVSESYNKQMRFLFADSLMRDWGGLAGLQGNFHCKSLESLLGNITKNVLKPQKDGVQGSIGDIVSTEEIARIINEYEAAFKNKGNLENIGLDFMRECFKATTGEEPKTDKDEFLAQVNDLLAKFGNKANAGLLAGLFGSLGTRKEEFHLDAQYLLSQFKSQGSVKCLQLLMRDTAKAFGQMRAAKETQEAAQAMLDSLKLSPDALFAIRNTDNDFYHKLRTAIFSGEQGLQQTDEEMEFLNRFVDDIAPKYVEKVLVSHAETVDPVGAQKAVLKELGVDKFKFLFNQYREARLEWKAETCSPFDSIITDLESEKASLMEQAAKLAERPGNLNEEEKEEFSKINEAHQKIREEINFVRAQKDIQKQTNGTFDIKDDAFLNEVVTLEEKKSGDAPAPKQTVRQILQEGVKSLEDEYKIHWKTKQFLLDKLQIESELPQSAIDTFAKVKEDFRNLMNKVVKINVSTDSFKSVSEVANILSFALCSEGALDPLRNAISPVSKADNKAVAEFAIEGGKKLINALQTALVSSLQAKLNAKSDLGSKEVILSRAETVVKQLVAKLTDIQQPRFNLPFLKAPILQEFGTLLKLAKTRGELSENDVVDLSGKFRGKALDAILTGVSGFLDKELPGLLTIAQDPKFADAVDRKLNAVISRSITKTVQESLADVYEKVRNVRVERNRKVDLSNPNLSSAESLNLGGEHDVDLNDEFASFKEDFSLDEVPVLRDHKTFPYGIDAKTVAAKLNAQLEHVWQDEMVSCPPGATGNCVLDTLISLVKKSSDNKEDGDKKVDDKKVDDNKNEANAPEAKQGDDAKPKVGTEDWLNKRKANVRSRMESMVSRYFDFERNVIEACVRMTMRSLEKQIDGFANLDPTVKNRMCRAVMVGFQPKIQAELMEFLDNPHAYGGAIRNVLEKVGNALGDFLNKDGLINFKSKDVISPMDKMAVDILQLQEWDVKLPQNDSADGVVQLTDMIRLKEPSQGMKDLVSAYNDAMDVYRGNVNKWLGNPQVQSAAIDLTKRVGALQKAVKAKGLAESDVDGLVRVANEIIRSKVKVEELVYINDQTELEAILANNAARFVIELLDKTDLADNLEKLKDGLAKASEKFLSDEVRVDGAAEEGVKSIADKLTQAAEAQKNAFLATCARQYAADKNATKTDAVLQTSSDTFAGKLKSLSGKLATVEKAVFAAFDNEGTDSVNALQDEISKRGFERKDVLDSAAKLLRDEVAAFKKSFSAQLRAGSAMGDLDPDRLGETNSNAHSVADLRGKLAALVNDRVELLTSGSLELTLSGFAGLLRKNGDFAQVDGKLFEKAVGLVFCQGCITHPKSVDSGYFLELQKIVITDNYLKTLLEQTFHPETELSDGLGSLAGASFRDRFFRLVNDVVANGAQGEAALADFVGRMRSLVGKIIAHFANADAFEKNLDVRLNNFLNQKPGADVIAADDFELTCSKLKSSIEMLRFRKSSLIAKANVQTTEADGWENYRKEVEDAFTAAKASFDSFSTKHKCLSWFTHQNGFEAIVDKLVAKDGSFGALFGESTKSDDMASVMSANREKLRKALSDVIVGNHAKWPNGRDDIARALEDGSLVKLVEGDKQFQSIVADARKDVDVVEKRRKYISAATTWVKASVREYLTKFVIKACYNDDAEKFKAYIKHYGLGTIENVNPTLVVKSLQGWLPKDDPNKKTYEELMASFTAQLERHLTELLEKRGYVFDPTRPTGFEVPRLPALSYIEDVLYKTKDAAQLLGAFESIFSHMADAVGKAVKAGESAGKELGTMLEEKLTAQALDWIAGKREDLVSLGLDIGRGTQLAENDFVKNIQAELKTRFIDPALVKLAEGNVYRRPDQGKVQPEEIDPKFYEDLEKQIKAFMEATFKKGADRISTLKLSASREDLEHHLTQMSWFKRANYDVFGEKADEIYRRSIDEFAKRFAGGASKSDERNWLNDYWNDRLKAFKFRCFDPAITDDKDVMGGERLLDVSDAVSDIQLGFFADLCAAEIEVRQQALLEQARTIATAAIEAYRPSDEVTFTESDRKVLKDLVMNALNDKNPRNHALLECMANLRDVQRQTCNRQTLLPTASTDLDNPIATLEKWFMGFTKGIDGYVAEYAKMSHERREFVQALEKTVVIDLLDKVVGTERKYSFAEELKDESKADVVSVLLLQDFVLKRVNEIKEKNKNKPDTKLIALQTQIVSGLFSLSNALSARLKEIQQNRWENDVMRLDVNFDGKGVSGIDIMKLVNTFEGKVFEKKKSVDKAIVFAEGDYASLAKNFKAFLDYVRTK